MRLNEPVQAPSLKLQTHKRPCNDYHYYLQLLHYVTKSFEAAVTTKERVKRYIEIILFSFSFLNIYTAISAYPWVSFLKKPPQNLCFYVC